MTIAPNDPALAEDVLAAIAAATIPHTQVTDWNTAFAASLASSSITHLQISDWASATSGFGAGSTGITSIGGKTGAMLLGTRMSIAGTVTPFTLNVSGGQMPNLVDDFGAVNSASPSGPQITNNTNAFNNAIASGKAVFVPEGTFVTNGNHAMGNYCYLYGAGPGATNVVINSTTVGGFFFASGTQYAGLAGMTIDRIGTASGAGAVGIATDFSGTSSYVSNIELLNLVLQNHYNGISLGPSPFSLIRDLVTQKNLNDGLVMTPATGINGTPTNAGALQWTLDHCISEFNAGFGFHVAGQAMAGGATNTSYNIVSMGEWRNISTFANSAGGIAVQGVGSRTGSFPSYLYFAACAIYNFRLGSNSFIGGDGNNELFLDTWGANHEINGVSMELAGQTNTGPSYSTGPSGIGYGVAITANNSGVSLIGVNINDCSHDGVFTAADLFSDYSAPTLITGCRITNNGLGAVTHCGVTLAANSRAGVMLSGGYVGQWNQVGILYPNNTGSGSGTQQYGLNIGFDRVWSVGCLIANNGTQNVFVDGGVTLSSASYLDALAYGGGGGSGSVTLVNSGLGLTGGPITGTGTLAVNFGTAHNTVPQADTVCYTANFPGASGNLLGTTGTAGHAALIGVGTGLSLSGGILSSTGSGVSSVAGFSGAVAASSLVTPLNSSGLALTANANVASVAGLTGAIGAGSLAAALAGNLVTAVGSRVGSISDATLAADLIATGAVAGAFDGAFTGNIPTINGLAMGRSPVINTSGGLTTFAFPRDYPGQSLSNILIQTGVALVNGTSTNVTFEFPFNTIVGFYATALIGGPYQVAVGTILLDNQNGTIFACNSANGGGVSVNVQWMVLGY